MPASLERLVVEAEPHVITNALIRECYRVDTETDKAAKEARKQHCTFSQMEHLDFSFQKLWHIQNLSGLDGLVKLQLDNNRIDKIENLAHLTNLTWLDLSFNHISKIEGLEALTKLTDLSLFSNQVAVIENLTPLTGLQVLSLGNNAIKRLDNVMYLRQFKNLQLVNLAGNPISSSPDYRSYVLSHLPVLVYLDYRRVTEGDITAAREAHQDEMLELHEREEQASADERVLAEKEAHKELMRAAGLAGVETLLDDLTAAEPEWAKLAGVPGLLDPWSEVKEKVGVATEEFKMAMLAQHQLKKTEHQQWYAAVRALLEERDAQSREAVAGFERSKKQLASLLAGLREYEREQPISVGKVRLMALKEQLMALELDTTESVQELCQEFDQRYSELAEARKTAFNTYFAAVRDILAAFFANLGPSAVAQLEKYLADPTLLDKLPEASRALAGDKEALAACLQACQDGHGSRLDGLEDTLVTAEMQGAVQLVEQNGVWEAARSRDRVSEVVNYVLHNISELDKLARDADSDEELELPAI